MLSGIWKGWATVYWHAVSSCFPVTFWFVIAGGLLTYSWDERLAYCELYVTVASMVCKFDDLEVFGVGLEDLVYDDYFSGYHPERARGVRVRRLKGVKA